MERFKQILELKIKNGDGTEANKTDLKLMNTPMQMPLAKRKIKKNKNEIFPSNINSQSVFL